MMFVRFSDQCVGLAVLLAAQSGEVLEPLTGPGHAVPGKGKTFFVNDTNVF